MLRLKFCTIFALPMNANKIYTQADKAGIASAVLCMVHCLVIPLVFLMKFWFADSALVRGLPSWWHQLDYVFLAISFFAVYHSAGHTLYREIKLALWVFWTVLAVAIVFEDSIHWLAYVASAGLIATHYVNIRRIRKYRVYQ